MELNLPTLPDGSPTTGNGSAKKVEEYRDLAVEFVLTGAADITVQMSFDGANWVDIAAMTNATAGTTLVAAPTFAIKFLRCVVNVAYVAGDKVIVGGHIS